MTFVVLCLLLNGGAVAQEEQQQQQKVPPKQVERANDKAGDAEKSTDEVARQVRCGRFVRLDAHAKKMGWVLTQPPAEAARDKVVYGWWQEWVELSREFNPPPPPAKPQEPVK